MANLGSWQHYNRDASISITVLGVFFVGLRFLSRHLGKVPLGLEDGLIVAAVVWYLPPYAGFNLTKNVVELIRHFRTRYRE